MANQTLRYIYGVSCHRASQCHSNVGLEGTERVTPGVTQYTNKGKKIHRLSKTIMIFTGDSGEEERGKRQKEKYNHFIYRSR